MDQLYFFFLALGNKTKLGLVFPSLDNKNKPSLFFPPPWPLPRVKGPLVIKTSQAYLAKPSFLSLIFFVALLQRCYLRFMFCINEVSLNNEQISVESLGGPHRRPCLNVLWKIKARVDHLGLYTPLKRWIRLKYKHKVYDLHKLDFRGSLVFRENISYLVY